MSERPGGAGRFAAPSERIGVASSIPKAVPAAATPGVPDAVKMETPAVEAPSMPAPIRITQRVRISTKESWRLSTSRTREFYRVVRPRGACAARTQGDLSPALMTQRRDYFIRWTPVHLPLKPSHVVVLPATVTWMPLATRLMLP